MPGNKTQTIPLHPQAKDSVERYVKIVEHVMKVVLTHQTLMLAYGSSTHETTSTIPSSIEFRRARFAM
jgi:hypothetical protein